MGRLGAINRRIDEIVSGLIAERRADPRPAGGILSMLVDARTEDGEGLSDKEIRADLITLVLAGHETTATTLAWLIDLLLHHPQALELVRAEAHSGATTYTEAVDQRGPAPRPPAPITGTHDRGPLPARRLHPGARHADRATARRDQPRPESYPDPDEFRPERFVGARPHPYAWIPFGGGVKRCIGASFSMCELVTVLHTILHQGRLEPVSTRLESPPLRATPVLVPRNGTRVYFSHETRSHPVVCR